MRLPWGIHWFSSSLALFLGSDGKILPVEDQMTAFVDAFVGRADDVSTAWAEEIRPNLGPINVVPRITRAEIVAQFPRNAMVRMFLNACDQFDVRGWGKATDGLNELVTHTKGREKTNDDEVVQSELEVVPCGLSQLVTHTNGGEKTKREMAAFISSPAKLKQIGCTILNRVRKHCERQGAGSRPPERHAPS